MAAKTDFLDGFHARPLASGELEFVVVSGGEEIVTWRSDPPQVAAIVTSILNNANAAFLLSGKPRTMNAPQGAPAIASSSWQAGRTNKGETILTAQAGDSVLAFNIPPDDIRKMAQFLTAIAWKLPQDTTLRTSLSILASAVAAELGGFAAVCRSKFRARCRMTATKFVARISGRALRSFKIIKLGVGYCVPRLEPANECIYCGAAIYSDKPGIRRHPLGAEHVVPEGLGGKLELPLASCLECEKITGATVEGDVLGVTLKAMRAFFKLRSPGGRPPPKTLPLTSSELGKKDVVVDIAIDDYPIMFNMIGYAEPGLFRGVVEEYPRGNGFFFTVLRWDRQMLLHKYGVQSFASERWDQAMFTRMLAKIGHSLAIGILGKNKFVPLLKPLILAGDKSGSRYIGGEPFMERTGKELHKLTLGYRRHAGKDYVVATIRLFADKGMPTYMVVVGESSESAFAKMRRVFSSKISRIASR